MVMTQQANKSVGNVNVIVERQELLRGLYSDTEKLSLVDVLESRIKFRT